MTLEQFVDNWAEVVREAELSWALNHKGKLERGKSAPHRREGQRSSGKERKQVSSPQAHSR